MSATWSAGLDEFRSQQIKLIIDAAERVLLREGLSQAKMTQIAAEAGISRPTLYKYFHTLDDLAFEVQLRALDLLNEIVRLRLGAHTGPAIEKIRLLFAACLEFYDQHPQHLRFSALFDFYYHQAYPDSQVEARYAAFLQRFSQLEKLIERGVQDGTLRADLDPHNTAFMIENTLLAMLQRMALRGNLIGREQNIVPRNQLVEMFAMMTTYLSVPPKSTPGDPS